MVRRSQSKGAMKKTPPNSFGGVFLSRSKLCLRATFEQNTRDETHDNRANERGDDRDEIDAGHNRINAQESAEPSDDQPTDYARDDIADEPADGDFDKETREISADGADNQPDDEIHNRPPFGFDNALSI